MISISILLTDMGKKLWNKAILTSGLNSFNNASFTIWQGSQTISLKTT